MVYHTWSSSSSFVTNHFQTDIIFLFCTILMLPHLFTYLCCVLVRQIDYLYMWHHEAHFLPIKICYKFLLGHTFLLHEALRVIYCRLPGLLYSIRILCAKTSCSYECMHKISVLQIACMKYLCYNTVFWYSNLSFICVNWQG